MFLRDEGTLHVTVLPLTTVDVFGISDRGYPLELQHPNTFLTSAAERSRGFAAAPRSIQPFASRLA